MAIKAVIFDLDDTLYLERDYAFSGFRAVAEAFSDMLGEPDDSVAKMQTLFDSPHRHRVFNQLLEDCGQECDSSLLRSMVEVFRNHAPTIRLLPDANQAIVRLAPNYRLGLITDGPAVVQRAKLDALGLVARLDAIIVTDELDGDAWKPDPTSYKNIAVALGVSPCECVYVADNPAKDFIAPNALEWLTVQIIRPQGVYKDVPCVKLGGPAKTIYSLNELDRLLM
jgi:putative hydrolase of the HAD superfamily